MEDYVYWTGVMGGIPLAAALIRLALDRWTDPVRARSIGPGFTAAERQVSDSAQWWMDA
jgi:hypothetical protein